MDPEITIIVHEEHQDVRGNAQASGDNKADKAMEDKILTRLARGDVWAWCGVEVRAEFRGITASDYLGGCCYKNEADFKTGPYYRDMVRESTGKLADMIADLQGVVIRVL